jgi:hypothetical protein
MVWLKMGHEQVAVQQHSGEKIVKVVSHTSGQAAHGFQFLGLPKTLCGLVVMRIVFCQDVRVVGLAVRAAHPLRSPAQPPAIGSGGFRVNLKGVTLPLKQFAEKAFAFGTILRVNEIAETERGR